jgi:hypothetical protein
LLSYPYVLLHGRIYKAQGAPLQNDRFPLYTTLPSTSTLHVRELPCNPLHKASSPGRRVLRISKRPEPVNIVYCLSCIWHEPFCYSRRHRPTPKNTLRGNPGCAVGPKTPTGAEQGAGATVQERDLATQSIEHPVGVNSAAHDSAISSDILSDTLQAAERSRGVAREGVVTLRAQPGRKGTQQE